MSSSTSSTAEPDRHHHRHGSIVDLGWQHLDASKFTMITFSASFTLRLITFPLSLLKTNHQTLTLQQNSARPTSDSLLRTIYKTQGIRGLYKGLGPNLIGNSSHVFYANVYERTREYIEHSLNHYLAPAHESKEASNSHQYMAPFAAGVSGICASAVQLSLSTPFDIITQKRMVLQDNDMHTIKTRHIFKQLLSEEGSIFGLWRGLSLALMTYAPTSGIVWSSYRYFKATCYAKFDNRLYFMIPTMCGAVSGGMASVLTIPLDTIKVRKQVLSTRKTKAMHIISDVYRQNGIASFYRGVIPRTCQYTISCAIIMTVYEWVKRASVNTSTFDKHNV